MSYYYYIVRACILKPLYVENILIRNEQELFVLQNMIIGIIITTKGNDNNNEVSRSPSRRNTRQVPTKVIIATVMFC